MESEALARAVIAKLREGGPPGVPGGRLGARTCCWGPSPRISTSRPTRAPSASWTCSPNRDKWARTSRGAGARRRCAGGGGHVSQRPRIRRWPAPRQRAFRERPRAGRAAPRLHHQRAHDGGGEGEVPITWAGRADLERRVVRAIGDPDARFLEDHLRLLRAVRFAARLEVRDRIRHVREPWRATMR